MRVPSSIAALAFVTVSLSRSAGAETLHFEFDELSPWQTWMAAERTESGYRFELPGTADLNHIDGVGPIYLLAHLPVPRLTDRHALDLRDASVTVRMRAFDVDLAGGSLAWWVASGLPAGDVDPMLPWQQTNWAYTSETIDRVGDGWEEHSITLVSEPSAWTYAGTNHSVHGIWGQRYAYHPLPETLAHVDATLHLVVLGVDYPPSGAIEIDWIEVDLNVELPSYSDVTDLMRAGRWPEARPLLRRLANAGHETAAFHLGNTLKYGMGGPVDVVEAARYYRQAANSEPVASVELAELMLAGHGVPRDVAGAYELLRQAGDDRRARFYLGMAALYGQERDVEAAIEHLTISAEGGWPRAFLSLGLIYLEREEYATAQQWLLQAEAALVDHPSEQAIARHNLERIREFVTD